MARKFPFEFDFNEDADPVEELHRLRVATTKHFKTMDALMKYLRSTPPVEDLIADLDKEIAKKKTNPVTLRKTKANPKNTRRRKTARRLAHT